MRGPLFVFPASDGADLTALTQTTVDVSDGSWSTADIDSTVSDVAVASGVHTWTMNAVGASTDYQITAGTVQEVWRAYKALTLSDNSTAITTDDNVVVHLDVEVFAVDSGVRFDTEVAFGICIAPTSTSFTGTTFGGQGVVAKVTSGSGAVALGSWVNNAATTNASGTPVGVSGTVQVYGGRGGAASAITRDAAGDGQGRTSRDSSDVTDAAALYLIVAIGTNALAVSAGDQFKATLKYTVLRSTSS